MLVRIIELDIVDDIKNNCIKSESGLNYTKYYQDLFINCPFLNRKWRTCSWIFVHVLATTNREFETAKCPVEVFEKLAMATGGSLSAKIGT